MRAGDLPVPLTAPHTIPPTAPIAKWPVGLHVALEQLPRSAYTWDDATTGTWDGAGFVWDAPFTAADHLDVTCDFTALDIDGGEPDELNLYPPVSATLSLVNPDGVYTPWTSDGRLVYWAPGKRLSVWTDTPDPAGAWRIILPGVAGHYLRAAVPVPLAAEGAALEVVARVQTDWYAPISTADVAQGFVFSAGRFGLRRYQSGTTFFVNLYWYPPAGGTPSLTGAYSAGWLPIDRPIWIRGSTAVTPGGTNRVEYNLADTATEPATGWVTLGTNTAFDPRTTKLDQLIVLGADTGNASTRTAPCRIARAVVRSGGFRVFDVGEADLTGDVAHNGTFRAATGQTVTVLDPSGRDLIRPAPPTLTWQIWTPGTVGNWLSVPDAPALNLTGDIDIRVRLAPDRWSSGAIRCLASKDIIPGQSAPRSWILRLDTTGKINLLVSTSGVGHIAGTSTAGPALADGAAAWIRAVRSATSGLMAFYWAADSAGEPATWTAVGTASPGTGALTNGAWPVTIGARQDGASEPFAGRIQRIIIRDAATNVIVADVGESDLTGDVDNAGTFTARVGGGVTVRQAAGVDVIRPGPTIPAPAAVQNWLFSGRVAGWERGADGAVTVTAYDGLAELAQDMPRDWIVGTAGQTPLARIGSIAFAAGYADPIGGDDGRTTLAAPTSTNSALEEIQVSALSDGGLFYGDVDGELVYRDRWWRQGRADQPKVWQVSDNVCDAGVIGWDVEAAADDAGLATFVELVNAAGLRAIARADSYWTNARYRLTHPDPDLWQTQAQGDELAAYLISQQSVPAMSVGAFTLYLSDPNQPDLWEFATTTRRGDVVNVVHDYLDTSGLDARLDLFAIVTAVDHNILPDGWTTTVRLSRSIDAVPLERWDVTGFTWDQPDRRNLWRF